MPTAERLGVSDVLHLVRERWGLDGRERGDEYDFLCPIHGERSIGSCSVNLRSGLWKCLACGKTGDLLKLGSILLGEPAEVVKRSLEPSTPEALGTTVRTKIAGLTHRKKHRKDDVPKLTEYRLDTPMDEMLELGFTPETIQKWGLRYVVTDILRGKKGAFTVNHSIAIPIRDEHGYLLAWCYRRTRRSPEWQPRYMYSPHISLSELWFGLQHYAQTDDIVIVEGARDAMWCDQAGIPALALLGSEMGNRKILQLSRYRRVVLFGDMDTAGVHAVIRMGNLIGDRTSVRVAIYPERMMQMYAGEKVDPAALSPVDLELMVESSIPWTTFLSRNNRPHPA